MSQCVSSSGCERNWSTFSLVHTKLRNKLSYTKLHMLVFVHYNLKLQIQQLQAHHLENKPADPVGALIDVALFDHSNPITEWLNKSMAESDPLLDEKDGQPSRELCRLVHQTNLGKRKHNDGAQGKSRKRAKESEEDEFNENESETDNENQHIETWESDSDDSVDDGGHTDGEQLDEAG